MRCLPVIFFLMLSVYSSAEDDNVDITTRANHAMVGDISNNEKRYNIDYKSDVIEENNNDILFVTSTVEDESLQPISFSRNIRSFDFYDDQYGSNRHKIVKENKNTDPKNMLNDIRSRNSHSNAYNEDQQKRMFFSQIFSLFDDDKNDKKSGKSYDKYKRSKSHIDHEIDILQNPKVRTETLSSGQNKHDSHRKKSSKKKEMEAVNDSFESTIEALLNNRSKFSNAEKDENGTKHKKKNKGKRQARKNNSRRERQLGGTESYENVESQILNDNVDHKFIFGDSTIKNNNRSNSFNDEISVSQDSAVSSFVTSVASISEFVGENENSETAYLVRTPSFNYYQTDVTYPVPDSERSMENKNDNLSKNNVNSIASNKNQDKVTAGIPDDSFNDQANVHNVPESVTFNPEVQSTVTDNNIENEHDLNMASDDTTKDEKEPINLIIENVKNNQNRVSDVTSRILNDLGSNGTRRMNYISVDKEIDRPSGISTIKEDIKTPKQELQTSKVYEETALPSNNARNSLSARIKLDLLIQLPSQIDVGNEI